MPVAPQSQLIQCPKCHWQQRWQPKSDALSLNDLPPERCPKCGHDALTLKADTVLKGLINY